MTLAILCSGQGTQHREMFALTCGVPGAAGLFSHAATLLAGTDPRELVRTSAINALYDNRIAQILCTLQSLAAAVMLRRALRGRLIIAGYSVGEVAAWGVAGAVDMYSTLDLAARRAEIMSGASSVGDGMLFVRGLSRSDVERLCELNDAAIAIVNPGDAFVIGGNRLALEDLARQAKAMRAAQVVRLAVEVASHTKRLVKASAAFAEILRDMPLNFPLSHGTRLLSGIDGSPVIEGRVGLHKLAAQICTTVQWADSLQGCIEAGATAFLELGPGHALCDMAAVTYRDVSGRSLEDFKTIAGVESWVARHVRG